MHPINTHQKEHVTDNSARPFLCQAVCIAPPSAPAGVPCSAECASGGAGFLGIAELLMRAGADVAVSTADSWIPLHEACFNGHLDIVQRLLEAKSQVHLSPSSSPHRHLALSHINGRLLTSMGAHGDCMRKDLAYLHQYRGRVRSICDPLTMWVWF